MDSIPLKQPSGYEAGTLKRIIKLKDDIIFRLNNPASIPSPTSATTTTTLGMSTSLSVPGVATTTSESVTTHNQTGVPNGAARQNTCSSGRIWASWIKKHWLISWLGNLNERLASWKYEKFMPVPGWIKRYIFSPGKRTVIFYMDFRESEASKCTWKSPHEICGNDTFCL